MLIFAFILSLILTCTLGYMAFNFELQPREYQTKI